MIPPLTIAAVAFLTATAAAIPARAQSVKTLAKPDAEFAEPFTNVAGVRELKDGRVVAIDTRDKVVQLVDFKTGSGTKIGREGSGPGEYALPMRLLALPADSSAVFDPLNARLLVVLPNGKPGNFITMEQEGIAGPGGGMRIGMQPPRYSDAKGRLYWTGAPFRVSEGGGPPKAADSVPVLRYDRSNKKTDTVAYVRVPKNNAQVSGNSGNMRVMIGAANPFAARDEWAVTQDGQVAVIRSPEYRVDWSGPRGRGAGAPIAYEKIQVTEKHKQNWRDNRKNQVAMRISMNNGQRSVQAGPPAGDFPDPTDWPDVMPPFLDNAAMVAPNGTIWVARTREANDDVPKYDVIDASGRVVMRVQLPKKSRVVGFGDGTVYTVRVDDDDLQYLQRYRM